MRYPLLIALIAILSSCTSMPETEVVIKNSSDNDMKDASAIITYGQIQKLAEQNPGYVPALIQENGKYIPTQVDNLNGDGTWDELFLVTDISANAEIKTKLTFLSKEDYPVFKNRTNIRFAKKGDEYIEVTEATRETHATNTITQSVWQMEGIAFENDKIAFRNYFDRRNGMDIFGKITSEMVLDKVGYKNDTDYHTFNPNWGVDVLKVGNSLGAGSIAFMYKDSLYRIGDNGTGTCSILTEGPLRSIFRFDFSDWKMGKEVIDVEHIVTIQAGKHYFENKVKYQGTKENLQFVTGIVNKKSKELFEADVNEKVKAFYTFDLQSEDTTLLGMGIMVDQEEFLETSETAKSGNGITETYCIHQKTEENKYANYRFYAVWERENDAWKTADGFEVFLEEEADLYLTKLEIVINN